MLVHRYRAFTLIELMIVIGIIGVLAAIIVPNFSQSRQEANLATCKKNLDNIGISYTAYKIRHKEDISDLDQLVDSGYIKNIPICPAAKTITYTVGTTTAEEGNIYIYCKGANHIGANVREDYPAWFQHLGVRIPSVKKK